MTRAEHLAWAKTRALQYVEIGDVPNAFASLCSDLRKHPELEDHAAMELGMMLQLGGQLSTRAEMGEFIRGCN